MARGGFLTAGQLFLVLAGLVVPTQAWSSTYSLDTSCSNPIAYGGTGNCASFCKTRDTTATCTFTVPSPNFQSDVNNILTKTCTQSSDARCSSAALASLFSGFSNIILAYCNDNYLVLLTNMAPNAGPYLSDILNPPGGIDSVTGAACRTRTWSIGSSQIYKIPLNPTLLSTATSQNNVNTAAFPGGSGGWLINVSNSSVTYGLPTEGAMAVAVWGQEIFPVFNNRATFTPEQCEVDSCNEHVGQGGGTPHLHGDPFGTYCGYNAKNYTNGITAHPPVIGFSFDGPWIYGRYLSASSPGYNTALDACGGHVHTAADATTSGVSVYDAVTDNDGYTDSKPVGTAYPLFTPGPFLCWKGDVSSITDFWKTPRQTSTTTAVCTGSSKYYVSSQVTAPTAWGLVASSSATTTTSPPPPAAASSSSPPPPALAGSVSATFQFPVTYASIVPSTFGAAVCASIVAVAPAGSSCTAVVTSAASRRSLLTAGNANVATTTATTTVALASTLASTLATPAAVFTSSSALAGVSSAAVAGTITTVSSASATSTTTTTTTATTAKSGGAAAVSAGWALVGGLVAFLA